MTIEVSMTHFIRISVFIASTLLAATNVMAIEEAKYDVIKQEGKFELRDYETHILAETIVEGSLEDAGNIAFKTLFAYISGENRSKENIEMTAPVSQESVVNKIEMTAPVGQQAVGDNWAISFMMPSFYTMATIPEPINPKVILRQVPARKMAAVRYSGTWSEENYQENMEELNRWIAALGVSVLGDPIWARYNAPFSLWFLRRNEVLIPIDLGTWKETQQDTSE